MPTEIVNTLTDDQVALIGCFVSLVVSGTVMTLSYYVGRGRRSESSDSARLGADVIPLPRSVVAQSDVENDRENVSRKDAA
jgi:hypothetical protein